MVASCSQVKTKDGLKEVILPMMIDLTTVPKFALDASRLIFTSVDGRAGPNCSCGQDRGAYGLTWKVQFFVKSTSHFRGAIESAVCSSWTSLCPAIVASCSQLKTKDGLNEVILTVIIDVI